jgi:hypothetical protein
MGIVKGSSIWKWVSVVITILAALTISLKITEILISYIIFLIGHLSMALIMLKDKDWSLFSMNIIWIVIDITGIITWG